MHGTSPTTRTPSWWPEVLIREPQHGVKTLIIVTGSAIAREDYVEDMRNLAIDHVRRSRSEPGCISHEVSNDAENPRRFVFVERWSDMAALQAHFRVEASRVFAQDLGRMAEGPPEMTIYTADPVQRGATSR